MAWLAVLEAVNAVGVTRRTEDEVKKKFRDFRSFVKKKVADARQEMLRTGKPITCQAIIYRVKLARLPTGRCH